jgi:hypothetical protein
LGGYNLNKIRSTDGGQSGAPFDAYDFSQEYARGAFSSLNFLYAGAYYLGPGHLDLNLFLIGNSGQPFNITTGRDTNGDTFFSERPAFATDLNEAGGCRDSARRVRSDTCTGTNDHPEKLRRGPGYLSLNVTMGRNIQVWQSHSAARARRRGAPRTTDATKDQKPPAKPQVQRPYFLNFSINAANVFNRTNKGVPVGNMASPFFLQSPSGSNFSFGPGNGSGGNRVISLRVRTGF